MGRANKEKVKAVQVAMVDLEEKDPDVIKTCGLCNTTLFDRLVKIEVEHDVPRRTVCKVFAEFYNEDRPPGEQVNGRAFAERLNHFEKSNGKNLSTGSLSIESFDVVDSGLALKKLLFNKVEKWPGEFRADFIRFIKEVAEVMECQNQK